MVTPYYDKDGITIYCGDCRDILRALPVLWLTSRPRMPPKLRHLHDRFCPRLPWLIFGLFASSVITFVMTGFEETLPANVAVAFSL